MLLAGAVGAPLPGATAGLPREAFGAAPPGAAPGALFVLLDGRGGGAVPRTELFRLWVAAMQEVACQPGQRTPEVSIVTLHEGYYESRLPLTRHTQAALQTSLARLEQEWVWAPLGLADDARGRSGVGLGLFPEHDGRPPRMRERAPAGAKRPRRNGSSPTRRLFAVGEDSALAALRSSLAQLAQLTSQRQPGLAAHRARLEYWTLEPEHLLAMAPEIARCVPPLVELHVLAVAPAGAPVGVAVAAAASQRAARARLLETELRSAAGPCGASLIAVKAVPLAAGPFARQVRSLLEVTLPLRLRLPAPAEVRELVLLATPTVLPPAQWRQALANALSEGVDFEVVCRVPASGFSCELFYGVPLLATAPREAAGSSPAVLRGLARKLRLRSEVLVLTANLSPVSFTPSPCRHFFAALPCQAGDGEPALTLRGAASADLWQPAAMLRPDEGAAASLDGASGETAARKDFPAYDPDDLIRDPAPFGLGAPGASAGAAPGWGLPVGCGAAGRW